jgi:3-hydroxyisobutyrate dehydrogenase
MSQIDCRIERTTGRITLRRPEALNALTHEMCERLEAALMAWKDDGKVSQVIIDAEGEKAFCAGGDIAKLYHKGRAGNFTDVQAFWREEYRLNSLIHHYPKPYIGFLQGYVMGGGVGISCHGSHRIVGNTTKMAMPECAIGLVPDVGGSYLLAHAPSLTGRFLGITGYRMNAADAMYAGFADSFIAEDIWDEVIAKLVSAGTPDPLSSFIDDAGSSQLATMQTEIDQMFTNFNSDKMATEQAKSTGELTEIITSALAKNAPLSMMAVDAMLTRLGPDCTFQRALEMEYRFTSRAMQQGEFLEGTRAMLIDKDRKPDWQYKTASELPEGLIDEMLAPTAFTQAFLATGDGL